MTKIDWRKNWWLTKRVWRWWWVTGLFCILAGIVWGCAVTVLGHESRTVFVVLIVATVVINYLVQGFPPEE
jgi:hypothetical protein